MYPISDNFSETRIISSLIDFVFLCSELYFRESMVFVSDELFPVINNRKFCAEELRQKMMRNSKTKEDFKNMDELATLIYDRIGKMLNPNQEQHEKGRTSRKNHRTRR